MPNKSHVSSGLQNGYQLSDDSDRSHPGLTMSCPATDGSSRGRDNNTQTFSFEDHHSRNLAQDHALVLPGRIPGVMRDDIRLLSLPKAKFKLYNAYR